MKIKIHKYDKTDALHPLFEKYASQNDPEPACLVIAPGAGDVWTTLYNSSSSIESLSVTFPVSSFLDRDELNDLMENVKPILRQFIDEKMDETEFSSTIQDLCENAQSVSKHANGNGGVWCAFEWMEGVQASELDALTVDAIEGDALKNGVTLYSVAEYVREMKGEL